MSSIHFGLFFFAEISRTTASERPRCAAGSGRVGIRPSVAVLPERRDRLLLGQRLGFRCRGHAGPLMHSWVCARAAHHSEF